MAVRTADISVIIPVSLITRTGTRPLGLMLMNSGVMWPTRARMSSAFRLASGAGGVEEF
jgi:hypothetical protein